MSTPYMSKSAYAFLGLGLVVQVLTYILTHDALLSLVSGMSGVISVVLCSQRKLEFYFFGFFQLITYVMLCIEQKLYAEIAENAFYFVTMIYGLYHWLKHYDHEKEEVRTRKLEPSKELLVFVGTIVLSILLFEFLLATDDTQPLMDAITTVPAFVAQILMILRYRESWYYWLFIDLGSIVMWSIAGNWCMVAQFVFWSVNCIYGLYKWKNDDKI